jgi:hypothetical protein
MGAYKSDWVKAKENARNLRAYRFKRADAHRPTSKQIDYLIDLGHKRGWEAAGTLDWVTQTFVLEHCHSDITCFMDLTKDEVAQAITRLKDNSADK